MNTRNAMRVYGCGGAGINITSYFDRDDQSSGPFAIIKPAFIDTSHSNLRGSVSEDKTYILPDMDGSGKIRKENHAQISNVIKQVLLQHKPEDFNVVVFSASGGSGSVIGPLIISELLERDLPVVAVVVGSDEGTITTQNTLNTLKSLEAISHKVDRPVVMHYAHNDRRGRRTDVDQTLHYVIGALSVLASGQIREMDTRDIVNWLMFNKTTSVAPSLAALQVFNDPADVGSIKDPLSVASVLASPDEEGIEAVPEYCCVGYAEIGLEGVRNFHMVISTDEVDLIVSNLKKTMTSLDEVRDSRVQKKSIVDVNDNVGDDGLVL